MFVELMPLLAGRTVMITVAREDNKTLRVNVIPTTKSGCSRESRAHHATELHGNAGRTRRGTRKAACGLCGVSLRTGQHARIGEGRNGRCCQGGSGRSSEEDRGAKEEGG